MKGRESGKGNRSNEVTGNEEKGKCRNLKILRRASRQFTTCFTLLASTARCMSPHNHMMD